MRMYPEGLMLNAVSALVLVTGAACDAADADPALRMTLESAAVKGGHGGKGDASESCQVLPNPVEVGAPFDVLTSGLRSSWLLLVEVQSPTGSESIAASVDDSGVIALSYTITAVGSGKVSIYRLAKAGPQLRAQCSFEVVVPCVPTTCQAAGAGCGAVQDGCGGALDCGACGAPDSCGGGGVPNQCGCTPLTCADQPAACGQIADGCGGTLDCGACPVCGDGVCEGAEDCASCAADCDACAPVCGDGACEEGEDCASCEADCGVCGGVCGDQVCDGNGGEMCTSCPDDCKTLTAVCGNGACEGGEDSDACYPDCGPSPWPNTWVRWEDEVLALINVERAAGTDCPDAVKAPVGALSMNLDLQRAARWHSWDQSYSGYFSHTSCNGRSPWTRASAAGTSASGECIGWGYSSPAAMVAGWMNSPGHCAILMGGYREIGVGFADPGGRLWTAMFR